MIQAITTLAPASVVSFDTTDNKQRLTISSLDGYSQMIILAEFDCDGRPQLIDTWDIQSYELWRCFQIMAYFVRDNGATVEQINQWMEECKS